MAPFKPRNVKIEPITKFWEGRQSQKSLPQKVGFEPTTKGSLARRFDHYTMEDGDKLRPNY